MNPQRFEVWVANLDPQIGTEPGKTRPVVVIQTDLLNPIHTSIIICPITTNVNVQTDILRVHLKPKETGLKIRSDILVDQIRAIDRRRLIKKLGSISTESQKKLAQNIMIILDLND
jgi:mRNA interferase MazF